MSMLFLIMSLLVLLYTHRLKREMARMRADLLEKNHEHKVMIKTLNAQALGGLEYVKRDLHFHEKSIKSLERNCAEFKDQLELLEEKHECNVDHLALILDTFEGSNNLETLAALVDIAPYIQDLHKLDLSNLENVLDLGTDEISFLQHFNLDDALALRVLIECGDPHKFIDSYVSDYVSDLVTEDDLNDAIDDALSNLIVKRRGEP